MLISGEIVGSKASLLQAVLLNKLDAMVAVAGGASDMDEEKDASEKEERFWCSPYSVLLASCTTVESLLNLKKGINGPNVSSLNSRL